MEERYDPSVTIENNILNRRNSFSNAEKNEQGRGSDKGALRARRGRGMGRGARQRAAANARRQKRRNDGERRNGAQLAGAGHAQLEQARTNGADKRVQDPAEDPTRSPEV